MGKRQGRCIHVSDEKRDAWNRVKKQRGISAAEICDRIKALEPDLPRPNVSTVRGILAGRSRSTPLYAALDQILASREDETAELNAADIEAVLVRAFRLAIEAGGTPQTVADAAMDAMAEAAQDELRAKLRALLPSSEKI